ncbi:MAG: hypothetical protein KDK04_28940, partial [Candidatus Competibacteraceae bacterium]|nr:hypothetical protein [Candidatus Competibacteraceae bacterium]
RDKTSSRIMPRNDHTVADVLNIAEECKAIIIAPLIVVAKSVIKTSRTFKMARHLNLNKE